MFVLDKMFLRWMQDVGDFGGPSDVNPWHQQAPFGPEGLITAAPARGREHVVGGRQVRGTIRESVLVVLKKLSTPMHFVEGYAPTYAPENANG